MARFRLQQIEKKKKGLENLFKDIEDKCIYKTLKACEDKTKSDLRKPGLCAKYGARVKQLLAGGFKHGARPNPGLVEKPPQMGTPTAAKGPIAGKDWCCNVLKWLPKIKNPFR